MLHDLYLKQAWFPLDKVVILMPHPANSCCGQMSFWIASLRKFHITLIGGSLTDTSFVKAIKRLRYPVKSVPLLHQRLKSIDKIYCIRPDNCQDCWIIRSVCMHVYTLHSIRKWGNMPFYLKKWNIITIEIIRCDGSKVYTVLGNFRGWNVLLSNISITKMCDQIRQNNCQKLFTGIEICEKNWPP